MKILFTRFPLESAFGGAEVQTLSLMDGLRARGHDISFLGSCPTLLAETRKQNIPATSLDIGHPPVTKGAVMTFLWRKKLMKQKLIDALANFSDVDVVCMLSISEKLLVTDWLTDTKKKVFWIEHDRIGPWLEQNPWLPSLRRQSVHATTVCVSELSRKLYIDLGWNPVKTVAIANGIDPNRFGKTRDQKPETGSMVRLGCVARLSPEKGVDVLIDAVSTMSGVHLTIIGKGPEEEKIRSMITAQELDDHVEIRADEVDLGTFYTSLDALILPSREHDPFGLVAAEAMACGTAVVVTDACGIAEYLADGTDAIVVQAGDPEALQAGIEQLRDADLRAQLSKQGCATALEKFSLEKMVDAYERAMV